MPLSLRQTSLAVLPTPATTPTSSNTAQQRVPPPVEHTGLDTLVKDILADFKAFPRRESTWVILGLGGATALAVHPADMSVNRHLVSSDRPTTCGSRATIIAVRSSTACRSRCI